MTSHGPVVTIDALGTEGGVVDVLPVLTDQRLGASTFPP